MRTLVWYWAIGCVMCGLAMGHWMRKCPNDDLPTFSSETLIAAAVWPAFIAAGIFSGGSIKPSSCKVAAS